MVVTYRVANLGDERNDFGAEAENENVVSLNDGPSASLQRVKKLSDAVDHKAEHGAEVDDSRECRHRCESVQGDARNVRVALADLVLGARIGKKYPYLPGSYHVGDGEFLLGGG